MLLEIKDLLRWVQLWGMALLAEGVARSYDYWDVFRVFKLYSEYKPNREDKSLYLDIVYLWYRAVWANTCVAQVFQDGGFLFGRVWGINEIPFGIIKEQLLRSYVLQPGLIKIEYKMIHFLNGRIIRWLPTSS